MLTTLNSLQNDLRRRYKAFCGFKVGHRDLSPDLNHNGEIEPEEWIKECPCFHASTILQDPPPQNPAYL